MKADGESRQEQIYKQATMLGRQSNVRKDDCLGIERGLAARRRRWSVISQRHSRSARLERHIIALFDAVPSTHGSQLQGGDKSQCTRSPSSHWATAKVNTICLTKFYCYWLTTNSSSFNWKRLERTDDQGRWACSQLQGESVLWPRIGSNNTPGGVLDAVTRAEDNENKKKLFLRRQPKKFVSQHQLTTEEE